MQWVGSRNVVNYRLQMSAEIDYHAISIKQSHCVIRQSSAVVSCRIINGAHSTNCHMRSGVLQGKR